MTDAELLEIAKRNQDKLLDFDKNREKIELELELKKISKKIDNYTLKLDEAKEERKNIRAQIKAL